MLSFAEEERPAERNENLVSFLSKEADEADEDELVFNPLKQYQSFYSEPEPLPLPRLEQSKSFAPQQQMKSFRSEKT